MLRRLADELLRADAWDKYMSSEPSVWAVQSGSEMAADDRRAEPYRVSHRASRAITIAVDHLHGLRLMILGRTEEDALNPHFRIGAPFTLLRGVLENAANAVWLLAPADGKERVLRSLRLGASEIGPSEDIRKLLGAAPGPRTREQRYDRIREVATAAGIDPDEASRGLGPRVTVREASHSLGLEPDFGEAMWRICSATSHGDFWAQVSVLAASRYALSADTELATTGANFGVLLTGTLFCTQLIDRGLARFGELRVRP